MERVRPVSRLPPIDVPRRKPDLSRISTNSVPWRKPVPAPSHGSGSPVSQRRVHSWSSASSRIGAATSNQLVRMDPTTSDSGAIESPILRGMTMICDSAHRSSGFSGQVSGSSRSAGNAMLLSCSRSRFAAKVSRRPWSAWAKSIQALGCCIRLIGRNGLPAVWTCLSSSMSSRKSIVTSSPFSPRVMVTPFCGFIRPPMRAPIVSIMTWMLAPGMESSGRGVRRVSSSNAQNAAQVRRRSSKSIGSLIWIVPVWLSMGLIRPESSPYTVPRYFQSPS